MLNTLNPRFGLAVSSSTKVFLYAAWLKIDDTVVKLQASGLCRNLVDENGEVASFAKYFEEGLTGSGNQSQDWVLQEGRQQLRAFPVDTVCISADEQRYKPSGDLPKPAMHCYF